MTDSLQVTPSMRREVRILVPLDDSIQAQRVLGYVRALARASHGVVKLVRVTDIEDDTSFNSLAQNAARLHQDGIAVEWSVASGVDAVHGILDAAAPWQPDVIAMASRSTSGVDRWLNGSVTDQIVRTAGVPVLVVPPNWQLAARYERPVRMLVPLDGSSLAEQTLEPVVRLAILLSAEVVLLRVTGADDAVDGASEYLRRLSAQLESALPARRINSRVVQGSPAAEIVQAAGDLDVDAIAIVTRGRGGLARVVWGSTATAVLEQSQVPLLLVGPHAFTAPFANQINLRGHVRTRDDRMVGEVHRVVVDLNQRAVVSIIVLGRDRLARDVVVPIDFVNKVAKSEVRLRVTTEELDGLPDFSYHEFVTPPSTWTSVPVPAMEQQRMGPHQQAVTHDTPVRALDGQIGHVEAIELDLDTGSLQAFVVRTNRALGRETRIPAEFVQSSSDRETLQVTAKLADIDGYLGHDRRSR